MTAVLLSTILLVLGYDVFMDDLSSPDGLALASGGTVFVSEETAGIVTGITPDGKHSFNVMEGLSSPEGLAWNQLWGVLVVEDVPEGRLLSSVHGVLQEGIPNPEGVTISQDGSIYYTWARTGGPTGICRWTGQEPDSIITLPLGFMLSGITTGPDHLLYACIETPFVGSFISVVQVNPRTGMWLPYAGGILSAEGLRFAPDGKTLMVACENDGSIVAVTEDGGSSVFASDFSVVEDILFLEDGSMLITDDGAGKILLLPWP